MLETAARYGNEEVQNVRMLWNGDNNREIKAALDEHVPTSAGRRLLSSRLCFSNILTRGTRARKSSHRLLNASARTVVINIEEYRARQVRQPTRWSSLLSTAAAAAGAFVISAYAVLNWDKIPGPSQLMSLLSGPAEADNKLSFSGDRVGRSETAPLLKICVTKDVVLDVDPDREIDPAILFQFLVSARHADRLIAVLGAPRDHGVVELAAKWGAVAACVYRSNSWGLVRHRQSRARRSGCKHFPRSGGSDCFEAGELFCQPNGSGIADANEKPCIGFDAISCQDRRANCLRFRTVCARIGTADPCQSRSRDKCLR